MSFNDGAIIGKHWPDYYFLITQTVFILEEGKAGYDHDYKEGATAPSS